MSPVSWISKTAKIRLLSRPGAATSSASAKIPAFAGTSSTLKLDSQRNHLAHSRRRWSRLGSIPCRASESPTSWEMFSILTTPLLYGLPTILFRRTTVLGRRHRVVHFCQRRLQVTSAEAPLRAFRCRTSRIDQAPSPWRGGQERKGQAVFYCLWDDNSTAVCCACQ